MIVYRQARSAPTRNWLQREKLHRDVRQLVTRELEKQCITELGTSGPIPKNRRKQYLREDKTGEHAQAKAAVMAAATWAASNLGVDEPEIIFVEQTTREGATAAGMQGRKAFSHPTGINGCAWSAKRIIAVRVDRAPMDAAMTMLHEMRHLKQQREGEFKNGGYKRNYERLELEAHAYVHYSMKNGAREFIRQAITKAERRQPRVWKGMTMEVR